MRGAPSDRHQGTLSGEPEKLLTRSEISRLVGFETNFRRCVVELFLFAIPPVEQQLLCQIPVVNKTKKRNRCRQISKNAKLLISPEHYRNDRNSPSGIEIKRNTPG